MTMLDNRPLTPMFPPPGTDYPVIVHNGKLRVRSKVKSSTPQAAAVKALAAIRQHPGYRDGAETYAVVDGKDLCSEPGCCGIEIHTYNRHGDPVDTFPAGWAR